MIRIAICDDEAEMLEGLCKKVEAAMEERGLLYEIVFFENGEDLLAGRDDFDLVFMDIQMDGATGIEIAGRLRAGGRRSVLIFVTVLRENVFDAFEVEAADYLLKPVDGMRLACAIDRALKRIHELRAKRLLIRFAGQCRSIKFGDIIYCEVINRKVYVHTEHETIEYYCRIEELEQQLDERFFRCHRSYLVHLGHVSGYVDGAAVMDTGQRLPVSRLRGKDFTRAILRYLKDGGS